MEVIPPDPQERYARWLAIGARTGFFLLAVGLFLYATELVEPHVPIRSLPSLWTLPAEHFIEQARMPRGWRWATLAHRGDLMNLAGIAVLAGCSILPLAAALRAFAARRERLLAIFCAVEIVVLLAAASGLVGGGH